MLKRVLIIAFGLFLVIAMLLSFADLFPKQFKEFEDYIGTDFISEKLHLFDKEVKKSVKEVDNKIFYDHY